MQKAIPLFKIYNKIPRWIIRLARFVYRLAPGRVARILFGYNKGLYWIKSSHIGLCSIGLYESDLIECISRIGAPKGSLVIDIGAHAGYYTLFFSSLVGDKGRVLAFEPNPVNSANLIRHLGMNDLNNVQVITAALGDAEDFVSLCLGASSAESFISTESHVTGVYVPVLCESSNGFKRLIQGDERVALIKIDVEGYEAKVLAGLRGLIADHKPNIFVSLHNANARDAVLKLMQCMGYAIGWASAFDGLNNPCDVSDVFFYPRKLES